MGFSTGSFDNAKSPRLPPAGVWRFGSDAEIAWIKKATPRGLTITSAIPPVFAAYATVVEPELDVEAARCLRLMLEVLRDESHDQRWWLGYLDTGADDVVFPDAPHTKLYSGWEYVLVHAGPDEAMAWRQDATSRIGPDLLFPDDRSWLMSRLWDDDWRCLGGPVALVDRLHGVPDLELRRVQPDEDATPPGHVAR